MNTATRIELTDTDGITWVFFRRSAGMFDRYLRTPYNPELGTDLMFDGTVAISGKMSARKLLEG